MSLIWWKLFVSQMGFWLQAEQETDEVYAQITLMPEADVRHLIVMLFLILTWPSCLFACGIWNISWVWYHSCSFEIGWWTWNYLQQTEPTKPDPCLPEPPRPAVQSFSKVLTASDTSTHGGFSVLRKHANECLPPLVYGFPCFDYYALTSSFVDCWWFVNFYYLLTIKFSSLYWPLGYDPANSHPRIACQRPS